MPGADPEVASVLIDCRPARLTAAAGIFMLAVQAFVGGGAMLLGLRLPRLSRAETSTRLYNRAVENSLASVSCTLCK